MKKRTAFKITRVDQLVTTEASRRMNIPFGIIDLSLAPTPSIGDSFAEIIESMGIEQIGAPGTTAVRIIPVYGKTVDDIAEFGKLLGIAPIMPVNQKECNDFINCQGRIPAPVHSFKN